MRTHIILGRLTVAELQSLLSLCPASFCVLPSLASGSLCDHPTSAASGHPHQTRVGEMIRTELQVRETVQAAKLAKQQQRQHDQNERTEQAFAQQQTAKQVSNQKWVKAPSSAQRDGVLNGSVLWKASVCRNPCDVVIELFARITPLLLQSAEGQDDDTFLLSRDHLKLVSMQPTYDRFVKHTAELQSVDISLLSSNNAKLLFWHNVHNLLCLHSNIESCSSFHLNPLWGISAKYIVGGHALTTVDIEHAVLRHRMSRPSFILSSKLTSRWSEEDPRSRMCPDMLVTHTSKMSDGQTWSEVVGRLSLFGRSHGFVSSPQLVVFVDPDTIVESLRECARTYLLRHVRVDAARRVVVVPKVLSWFRQDFGCGKDKDVLDFINSSCFIPQLNALLMMQQQHAQSQKQFRITLKFSDFDWSLGYKFNPYNAISHLSIKRGSSLAEHEIDSMTESIRGSGVDSMRGSVGPSFRGSVAGSAQESLVDDLRASFADTGDISLSTTSALRDAARTSVVARGSVALGVTARPTVSM